MKAILVIDMPESCHDCTLIYPDKYKDIWCCIACDCVVEENVTAGTLYKGCPLKPTPKQKDLRDYAEKIDSDFNLQIRMSDYINGYNKCIDEILGEKDEKHD